MAAHLLQAGNDASMALLVDISARWQLVICRIVPRHRFMRHTGVLHHGQPVGISPAMLVGDLKFATCVAKSTLQEYETFRSQLKGRL